MRHLGTWGLVGAILAGCGQSLETAGEQEVLLEGETRPVFGVPVSTWARLDRDRRVRSVGVTLPIRAIEAAPTDPAAPPTRVSVGFPEEVRKNTFFQFFGLDYSATGHRPHVIYGLPHFDFHFYGVPESEVQQVDCADLTVPGSRRMPEGYAIVPNPGEACEPQMGIHAVDLNAPELRRERPETFTRTMVIGFYRGSMTFLEPMATREFLLRRTSFTLNVPRPEELGRETAYPTSFSATYDPSLAAYQFVWSNFTTVR